MRQTIVDLDGFQRDGAPWSYRFGLYQGDKLDLLARSVYFNRFRPMLLNPAQANFVQYLRSLPDAPTATDDSSVNEAAYKSLKAYLITAGYHDKSDSQFLTPVFLQYWIGSRQVDSSQQELARKQIDFYATDLARQDPYSISQDKQVVDHARGFLSHFVADNSIYLAMLSDADKTGPSIDFNRQYPAPPQTVLDSYVVRGAFTKSGFVFMQDALQKHIDRYAKGEAWVLGDQFGPSLDLDKIRKNLSARYSSDYIDQWHTFLTRAQVAGCGGIHEAPDRLNSLSGPGSPLLLLFYTVAYNTAVADQQIKSVFQSTQLLVDPNIPDRHIGAGNQNYMGALLNLSSAIAQVPPASVTMPPRLHRSRPPLGKPRLRQGKQTRPSPSIHSSTPRRRFSTCCLRRCYAPRNCRHLPALPSTAEARTYAAQ